MRFDELDSGRYTIFAGALDRPDGRYTAAVSVVARQGGRRGQPVFQDFKLAGGHAFESAQAALRFATQTGQDAVRRVAGRPTSMAA